jgi:hypothetical protein
MGPILEAEAGNHLEWKYTDDRSLIYKVYWAQWVSLAVSDGILKRHLSPLMGDPKWLR